MKAWKINTLFYFLTPTREFIWLISRTKNRKYFSLPACGARKLKIRPFASDGKLNRTVVTDIFEKITLISLLSFYQWTVLGGFFDHLGFLEKKIEKNLY